VKGGLNKADGGTLCLEYAHTWEDKEGLYRLNREATWRRRH